MNISDPTINDKTTPAEVLVGRKLRELRNRNGLSLRALADRSGLNINTLSLVENGKSSPSVSTRSSNWPRRWKCPLRSSSNLNQWSSGFVPHPLINVPWLPLAEPRCRTWAKIWLAVPFSRLRLI